jgi:hypothetical protein
MDQTDKFTDTLSELCADLLVRNPGHGAELIEALIVVAATVAKREGLEEEALDKLYAMTEIFDPS